MRLSIVNLSLKKKMHDGEVILMKLLYTMSGEILRLKS